MRQLYCIIIVIIYSVTLSAQERVTLLFVGDIMQHDTQIQAAQTPEGYDYSDCFKHLKKEICKADIAIGNLEVTLGGKPYRGYPSFSAPDEFLYAIKDAGFDILLTTNNHCLDKGKQGLKRTISMLDSLQIPCLGTYRHEEERTQRYPLLIEKNNIRIAFLAYTYDTNGTSSAAPHIVNYIDTIQIKKDILSARRMKPDAIIACMHWGLEYHSLPNRSQKELANWMISQGVDHIIGSHPHVPQPMEIKKDEHTPAKHLIAYSLGNFISNMSRENADGGVMINLHLKKQSGITRLDSCSYSLIWTSRPILSQKKNFELYPASFLSKPIQNEEYKSFNNYITNTRTLYQKHNIGIKEYFF
ncbi:MAG: CapA family protein [Bacteroides sp.]|nr:CapA family protein [Bacteroides sp.]